MTGEESDLPIKSQDVHNRRMKNETLHGQDG